VATRDGNGRGDDRTHTRSVRRLERLSPTPSSPSSPVLRLADLYSP
jgi:hypothetical protein